MRYFHWSSQYCLAIPLHPKRSQAVQAPEAVCSELTWVSSFHQAEPPHTKKESKWSRASYLLKCCHQSGKCLLGKQSTVLIVFNLGCKCMYLLWVDTHQWFSDPSTLQSCIKDFQDRSRWHQQLSSATSVSSVLLMSQLPILSARTRVKNMAR